MSVFIYTSTQCQRDAERHGLQSELETFKSKILKNQNTTYFDRFPIPYIKKRFRNQLRLIAAEKFISGHNVIIFYRIISRGSNEYSQFIANPTAYGQQHFEPLIDDDLNSWVEIQSKQNKTIHKPELTDEEKKFLYGFANRGSETFSDQYFIYETVDWINSIRNREIENRLINIPSKLQSIVENKNISGNTVQSKQIDDYFYIHFYIDRNEKILFLLKIDQNNQYETNFNNTQDIKRQSLKSYPLLITICEDKWVDIERNDDANISLSPEEMTLLKSINSYAPNSGFPLFINGRAGSGKSTILHYIFSDFLIYYTNEKFSFNPPLFLTYSNSLVEESKKKIEALLKYNYANLYHNNCNDISIDSSIDLNKTVITFKDFLLSIIDNKIRENLFNEEKYMDYSKFKIKWLKHFQRNRNVIKKVGPDISWHIIRTYIKGNSEDGFFDPDDYKELPEGEKSVTPETFQFVFNNIWENWYKPLCQMDDGNNKFWDDQDLVRYILTNDLIKDKYPGVFCDEAQDFTKIELELIMRLNLFTDKKIDTTDLKRIPFVFAGDPFQTLNPTGFRWESVKANYVEKFINSISPELRYGDPKLNYKELTFNYRSTESIVKLSNSIQLLRKILFNYHQIKPQKTWKNENNFIPQYFYKDNPNNIQQIQHQAGLSIIVPCNLGEEKTFVQKDPILNQVVNVDDEGVPQNVYSPMRAKGLEFERVMLYDFASYLPNNFNLSAIETFFDNKTIDEQIPFEYFINQLYVAISRSQNFLFILDDRGKFEKLWKFVSDLGFQDQLLRQTGLKNEWENEIGSIGQGNYEIFNMEEENLSERARTLEIEGKNNYDSYLLRQAALYYRNLGEINKANESYAFANFFEENYEQSGEYFLMINNFEKALEAYWKGELYKKIDELKNQNNEIISKPEVIISSLLIKPNEASPTTYINLLSMIVNIINNTKKISTWKKPIIRLGKVIYEETNFETDTYKDIYNYYSDLTQYFTIPENLLGNLSFRAALYEKTVFHFEKANERTNSNYKKAELFILDEKYQRDSAQLSESEKHKLANYYFVNNRVDEALNLFQELKINNKILEIADHFYNNGQIFRALELYKELNDSEKIFKLLNEKAAELNEEKIYLAIEYYIKSEAINRNWEELISFFNSVHNDYLPINKIIKNVLLNGYEHFLEIFVHEIANDVLIMEDHYVKEQISKFLYFNFVDISVFNKRIKNINPQMLGCAIEKAGRDIDALQYYEHLQRSDFLSNEIKSFAKKRWIKVKLRQSEREKKQGEILKSKKHFDEAQKELESLNISLDEFEGSEPIYPNWERTKREEPKGAVTGTENTKNKTSIDNFVFTLNGLKLDVYRNSDRINISLTETGETISLLVNERKCKSLDKEINFDENVEKWFTDDLEIQFLSNNDSTYVKIRFINFNMETSIYF